MSNLKSYRTCFVPLCTNNTKKTPEKMFFNVPQDVKRRNKWFQAAHRVISKTTSNFFCCEDHFDIKDDMENYTYYTMMGGGKAKIKINVVPHKFDCQPNRKRQGKTIFRPVGEKRRRQQIIEENLRESSKNFEVINTDKLNIDTIKVEHIEVEIDPLNILSDTKNSVETQTDIKRYSVAVQVNRRPKYRSVSVQCKISSNLS